MTTLDELAIRALINAAKITDLEKLEVFARIDSTNTWLQQHGPVHRGSFRAALADHQTTGRGREGRRWLSAPGRSLCLSLAHRFARTPANLGALTLALGVSAVEVLAGFGVSGVRLKWPNDLMAGEAKLGGILVETELRGHETQVVAGIGLNLRPPHEPGSEPEAMRIAAVDALTRVPPTRETLAAALLLSWRQTILDYPRGGFDSVRPRYAKLDWLLGKTVRVAGAGRPVAGVAAGISAAGALFVDTADGIVPVVSGSVVEVRPA